ncbi:nuclear receptor subfamily 0 group B member 2-like [Tiliqua scincoides]|uniref:nuclear receptor subfamily 0 group B member 2-like n=1 Tax=Tiliqua scincoides TaxID=71010 RepID=UPI0034634DC9
MATQRLLENDGKCCCNAKDPNSILYKILTNEEYEKIKSHQQPFYQIPPLFPHTSCPSEGNRTVILKTPDLTCTRALDVFLKTIIFIRKLPSFFQLPLEDQILLSQHSWVPLFILGLAQERLEFDLKETFVPSVLTAILDQSHMDNEALEHFSVGAFISEVQKIKNFLGKFWSADICAKEYAYLKGIVLFNPELRGLKYHGYVQTLQLEAHHTLMEFTSTMHSKHHWRYTWIMEMLAILRNFDKETEYLNTLLHHESLTFQLPNLIPT